MLCSGDTGAVKMIVSSSSGASMTLRWILRRHSMQPRPKPKKHATRTKFLKYAKTRISDETQRIIVISRNRLSALIQASLP